MRIGYKLELNLPDYLRCNVTGERNEVIKTVRDVFCGVKPAFISAIKHSSELKRLNEGLPLDPDKEITISLFVPIDDAEKLVRLFSWLEKTFAEQELREIDIDYTTVVKTLRARGYKEYWEYHIGDHQGRAYCVESFVNMLIKLPTRYAIEIDKDYALPRTDHHLWLEEEKSDTLKKMQQEIAALKGRTTHSAQLFAQSSEVSSEHFKEKLRHIEYKIKLLIYKCTGNPDRSAEQTLKAIKHFLNLENVAFIFPNDPRLEYGELVLDGQKNYGVYVFSKKFPKDKNLCVLNSLEVWRMNGASVNRSNDFSAIANADMRTFYKLAVKHFQLTKVYDEKLSEERQQQDDMSIWDQWRETCTLL